MNYMKLIVPLIVVVLVLTFPPLVVSNVVAGSAGLVMLQNFASEWNRWHIEPQRALEIPVLTDVIDDPYRTQRITMTKGTVECRTINGKLVTRFYKHAIVVNDETV